MTIKRSLSMKLKNTLARTKRIVSSPTLDSQYDRNSLMINTSDYCEICGLFMANDPLHDCSENSDIQFDMIQMSISNSATHSIPTVTKRLLLNHHNENSSDNYDDDTCSTPNTPLSSIQRSVSQLFSKALLYNNNNNNNHINNNNNNNKNNNGSDQLLGFVLESNNKNINSLSEDIVGRNNNNNINESRQMISNKGINTKNANNNNNTNNKSATTNTNNKNSNGRNSVTMGFNTNNMNMNMNHGQGGVGGGGLRRKLSQSFSHQNRAISRTGNNSNNNITMSLSPEKSGFFNISMMLKSNNTHNYRNNSRIEEFTNFLAGSNVNLVEVIESVQELLNLYEAWQLYDEGSVRQNVKTVLMALHTRTGGGVGVTGSSVMSV